MRRSAEVAAQPYPPLANRTGCAPRRGPHEWPPVQRYWTNFVRTGSPNGAGLPHWPTVGARGTYLSIEPSGTKAKNGLRTEVCDLMYEDMTVLTLRHSRAKSLFSLPEGALTNIRSSANLATKPTVSKRPLSGREGFYQPIRVSGSAVVSCLWPFRPKELCHGSI